MESYISPLNYSIFVILYITSFVYLYTKYSEIVGLGVLTVIQIAFTLFFGKELSQIIINHTGGPSVLNFASMMSLYGSFLSMILLTVTLVLTSITIFDIQEKYNKTVSELCLVRLHPDAKKKNYELISVPMLDQEINDIVTLRMCTLQF